MAKKRRGKSDNAPEKSDKAPTEPAGTAPAPESGQDTTGREMAATVPGKNPFTGAPQGELARHPPGSNGGVHRGPDRYPRVTQGTMFKAMIGPSPVVTMNAQGRRKTGRRMVDGAMVDNLAVRIRCIAVKGSDPKARLRRIQHFEQVTHNVSRTCRFFGISRGQFYTWLRPGIRVQRSGAVAVAGRVSRRALCALRSSNDFERSASGAP